ncbi:MAG: hypothetical protein HN348_28660, partial [Proteobacteria bacterium]|nr:hypothetical protein [Pseudomonadota bacterium]
RWQGDRLVSAYYYGQVNGDERDLGIGAVLHLPQTTTLDETWAFELAFADNISYEDLVVYFETLTEFGPPEFKNLHWLIRSTKQENTAQEMEEQGLLYSDRILRYTDLTVPGEVEVYNPGLTGGRVYMVRAGEDGIENSYDESILVLEEIPDYLPPCAALITSVPQTPLSHISLLARSRGIPNLYVAGITENAAWDAWKRVHAKVAMEATPDHQIVIEQMSPKEYSAWNELLQPSVPEVQTVDVTSLPWTVDLADGKDMLDLRPEVGGKAAGMGQLLLEASLDTPDLPLAISIRGYQAHIDQLTWLEELVDNHPFGGSDDAQLRYLVLEGLAAYDERYRGDSDAIERDEFLDDHPPGDTMGDLARAEGLRAHIEDLTMPVDVLEVLPDEVTAHFASIDAKQGLRFRSSSNVEDIEGFNGAGLYTSTTGYREPESGQLSIEKAIRHEWASYWNSEAFEEREAAGIEHLQGGMGVLVHPRFDDEFEVSNHVLTVSLLADGSWEMLVNGQIGSISVANPPTECPPVLPEQTRVTAAGVERISESSELESGDEVLTDTQLLTMFEQSKAVAEASEKVDAPA